MLLLTELLVLCFTCSGVCLHSFRCLFVDKLPGDYEDVSEFRKLFSKVAEPAYCQVLLARINVFVSRCQKHVCKLVEQQKTNVYIGTAGGGSYI